MHVSLGYFLRKLKYFSITDRYIPTDDWCHKQSFIKPSTPSHLKLNVTALILFRYLNTLGHCQKCTYLLNSNKFTGLHLARNDVSFK